MKEPLLLADTLRKHYRLIALLAGYIAFAWSCYLLLQFGFVLFVSGFFIPQAWWGPVAYNVLDSLVVYYLKFALRFAVAFAPMLAVLALAMAWFARLFQFKPVPRRRLALSVPVNVAIALPFFLLIPVFMLLNTGPIQVMFPFVPSDWVIPGLVVAVWFGVALAYFTLASIPTSSKPGRFVGRFLSSARFWFLFTAIGVSLGVALLNVAATLFDEVEGAHVIRLETLVLTALPVAFLALALPLIIQYFGNREFLR